MGYQVITSLGEAFFMAVLAHILVPHIQRWLTGRRSGSAASEGRALASRRSPDVPVRRRLAHATASARSQRVRATTRLASHMPTMTPDHEVDLIERGLPEIMVRSGRLDYASLTSGCMADRLRNGYA